jgi:hypothetical protein
MPRDLPRDNLKVPREMLGMPRDIGSKAKKMKHKGPY